MIKKYINFFTIFTLILSFAVSAVSIFSLKNYQDINTNQVPAFIIQQGKLSQKQIADLTKLSDAKNIWLINDNEDYKRATELIKQSTDVVSYANQVGRLDAISILLGIIAIIFGFAGIVGFLHIETMVKTQVDQAIKKEFEVGGRIEKLLREEANKRFNNIESVHYSSDPQPAWDEEKYYQELFNRTTKEFKIDNK